MGRRSFNVGPSSPPGILKCYLFQYTLEKKIYKITALCKLNKYTWNRAAKPWIFELFGHSKQHYRLHGRWPLLNKNNSTDCALGETNNCIKTKNDFKITTSQYNNLLNHISNDGIIHCCRHCFARRTNTMSAIKGKFIGDHIMVKVN